MRENSRMDSSNRIKCATYSFSTSQRIECDGPCPCEGSDSESSSEETGIPMPTPTPSTKQTTTKLYSIRYPYTTGAGVEPDSPPPIYQTTSEEPDVFIEPDCWPFCKKETKNFNQ